MAPILVLYEHGRIRGVLNACDADVNREIPADWRIQPLRAPPGCGIVNIAVVQCGAP
jgi:hypothetical protein